MKAATPLLGVLAIVAIAVLGAHAHASLLVLAVIVPYAAFAVFLVGFCYRVARWAWAPVPFRIPTTCGQQKSLPWIKPASLDNPSTRWGALRRMAMEIFLFRSLFRDNRARLHDQRLVLAEDRYLWLGALAFHWSLLVILLRHLRLFLQPVPDFFSVIEAADGAFVPDGTPIPQPARALHIFANRLPGLVSSAGNREFRPAYALRNPGRRGRVQAICAWISGLPPKCPERSEPDISNPLASRQFLSRIFPVQQAHAPGRSFSQPYPQPGQQQSQPAPRQPLESSGENSLLCGMGERVPRQTESREPSARD